MTSLLAALIDLVNVWSGYRQAQRSGPAKKVFFVSLFWGVGLCLIVVGPLVILPMETIQRHPLATFGFMGGGIIAGVTLLVVIARKINAGQLAKKSSVHPAAR